MVSSSDQDTAQTDEANEVEDLQVSLSALGRLSSRQHGLEDFLTRVAEYAVRAIPGAEGAGLTLLQEGRTNTIVASDTFVSDLDDVQYSLGEGPCVTAAADAVTIRSGALRRDPRWPRFASRIADLGVQSIVSLPLITSDGVVGAMNIYAHDENVFDEHAATLGEVFATPAAIAVQNAKGISDAQRLASRLQSAVTTRSAIDRAVGIIMSRSGGTAEAALHRLRTLSQPDGTMVEVAQQIVDEAVRRASSRQTRSR